MPTKPTKIHALFHTFDSQSEEIKSLINFFMEGASVFFRGNYEDSNNPNKLTSYTGELRFNNRPLFEDNAKYTPYELVIPYKNYFVDEFPTFDNAPQTDLSEEDLPYVEDNNPIPVVNGVTNYTVDSLTSVKTAMNLYKGYFGGEAGNYFPTSEFVEENTISLPVELIPKVGDVPNTDTRLKPKQIALHNTNEDGLYLQKIAIEDILDSSGNPITDGFVYDFQLKTDVFGLKDTSTSGSSINSVFYKIGITRLDTSVELETIVNALKEEEQLHIVVSTSNEVTSAKFHLISKLQSHIPSYTLNPTENAIEQHIGTGDISGIATKAIMAMRNDSNQIIALIYIKMYNSLDGSEYTGLINHSNFEVYYDGQSVNLLDLSFSDPDNDSSNPLSPVSPVTPLDPVITA